MHGDWPDQMKIKLEVLWNDQVPSVLLISLVVHPHAITTPGNFDFQVAQVAALEATRWTVAVRIEEGPSRTATRNGASEDPLSWRFTAF
ncbi:hypothetical protein RB195_012470 [Necator americanus]|uniref:Uncharacterized protein n=1 Tax=Necator americanus TaxID=51031 RepID=A0ABR1D791_NECAM